MKILLLAFLLSAAFANETSNPCTKYTEQHTDDKCVLLDTKIAVFKNWTYYTIEPLKKIELGLRNLRVKDISDPVIKERTLKSAELMKDFSRLDTILKILKSETIDKNYYQVIDHANHPFSIVSSSVFISFETPKVLGNLLLRVSETLDEFRLKKLVATETTFIDSIYFYNPTDFFFYDLEGLTEIDGPLDEQSDFRYWEPERLSGNLKTCKEGTDVYAFGVWLYKNLYSKNELFPGKNLEEYAKGAREGKYEWKEDQPLEMAIAVHLMIFADPALRISTYGLTQLSYLIEKLSNFNYAKKTLILNNKVPLDDSLMNGADENIVKFYKDWIKTQKTDFDKEGTNEDVENNPKTKDWLIVIGGIVFVAFVALLWWLWSKFRPNEADTVANNNPLVPEEATQADAQAGNDHRVEIDGLK